MKIVKANDAVLKNIQNQGQNLQNQMANVTSLLTNLCNDFKISASTSNSGTLPSQTVTNPRGSLNSDKTGDCHTRKRIIPNLENTAQVPPPEEEDSFSMKSPTTKSKENVNVETQDLNYPRTLIRYQSKLPLPRVDIGLKDALVEMPKFNKWLSSLLRNKEKLKEIAITTVNV
ncbi:hypothetical protein Tco_1070703 [Tanacetum coccineum]|uniref:Reverse transcriptase domain-containing protein n=1 Tax=Tanacetum coccineum TaxID=301880 RepID=A0ABQ5HM70_9ASTR